jgi:hypothetical protein
VTCISIRADAQRKNQPSGTVVRVRGRKCRANGRGAFPLLRSLPATLNSAFFPYTTSTRPSTGHTHLNIQAGPHKCERMNPHTGKVCYRQFSRPSDLTRHEHTIHHKQQFPCNLCEGTSRWRFSCLRKLDKVRFLKIKLLISSICALLHVVQLANPHVYASSTNP